MFAKSFNFYRSSVTKQLPFKKLATINRSTIAPTLKQFRYISHEVSKDKLIVFDTTLRDGEQVNYFICKIRKWLINSIILLIIIKQYSKFILVYLVNLFL